jgi:hypothetical protein
VAFNFFVKMYLTENLLRLVLKLMETQKVMKTVILSISTGSKLMFYENCNTCHLCKVQTHKFMKVVILSISTKPKPTIYFQISHL